MPKTRLVVMPFTDAPQVTRVGRRVRSVSNWSPPIVNGKRIGANLGPTALNYPQNRPVPDVPSYGLNFPY